MIERIKYGNTNTYLLRGTGGAVLVDTDYAGTMSAFYGAIKERGVRVSDITYVLATHYHPDHVGLVGALTEQGVGLLLMESQVDSVHFADEIFAREHRSGYQPIDENRARIVRFDESRSFLSELGIAGEIIQTPSHSKDSISVILDCGACIVGDLEPIDFLPAYERNEALMNDWDRILAHKPERILYAHANEKVLRVEGEGRKEIITEEQ